ncbi:hypothetical protein BYT27DRAFT_7224995 [Phlegmacium glaucopus]|nr:hypothetical protein BYT27DRAFT_7224995 [Phlegmacium glaucopus]
MNNGDDLTEVEAVPFQGDAFGTVEDYAMDMFGQLGDDHDENMDTRDSGPDNGLPALSELSDNEDDNEAHMVVELEKSWEPHQEGAPHLEVEDDHDKDGPGNVEVEPNLEEEDNNSDSKVWYTNKSPNAWAGQPLSHEETCDSGYASVLGGQPQFKCRKVVQSGEVLEFYSCNIIECLHALWGDPDFADDLILKPERLYADEDMTICIYHDMNTGRWWWDMQVQAATQSKNITIVLLIISSDKTQLTTFRGKKAYPVYLTIGNIPKHIHHKPSRQSQVLLAYLPTSTLGHITNKASHCRCLSNLFHHCMQYIVKPMESAGHDGILLVSGNGAVRRCFPIISAYVDDYSEQTLLEPHDTQKIIEVLSLVDRGATKFSKACTEAGIKPIQCVFWKNLPFIDIYHSITPNILHQLYQGILKHLISWIQAAFAIVCLPNTRYPIHTSEMLGQINDALHMFHLNCDIFVSLGIHKHFNIPKLHNSTADNFNTEYTEWPHINLAKDAYTSTNFKDEFPQMTLWLYWKECIPIEVICTKYGATQFIPALSWFITQYQHPEYSKAQVKVTSKHIHIPFSKVSVFHHVKFVSYDVYSLNPLDESVVDSIHVDPVHLNKYRKIVPGRFDMAIIQVKDSCSNLGLKGTVFDV